VLIKSAGADEISYFFCCGFSSPQGPQIVELLKKNPTVAIPVIIVRLEQKEAEWLRVSAQGDVMTSFDLNELMNSASVIHAWLRCGHRMACCIL
jgi:hypothetical protein